jgi:HlyD family secretion protein
VSALRRRLGVALGAAALLALAWLVLRAPAVPVELGEVTRGPLRVTVDEEGETRVRQRFTVAAPTTGRLLRIELDEGDPVQAGAVVARIVPSPLDPRDEAAAQARLEAAEAQQSAADARRALSQAALAQARRDAERAARLREAGTISAEAHEQARLAQTRAQEETRAAGFALEAAKHEVQAARAALISARPAGPRPGPAGDGCGDGSAPCVDVRAPVAGEVLRVREESERIVLAGTVLLELGDPADIEIVADVLSADAVRIRPGAEIAVEEWGGDGALRARVRRVEPSGFTKVSALGVEEQRVNVIGDFVDPPGGLGDGFRVEVRVVVWEAPDVVRVPGSALFRRADGWAVFVEERGRARLREVAIGQRGAFETEVRSGLAPGERVVLHPSDRLADGTRLRAAP